VCQLNAILHHTALALAAVALAGAGFRAASLAAPRGLERAIAAAVLAIAAAVVEALGLGLVSLGGSAAALTAAAVATWVAARLALPAPEVPAGHELGAWWRGLDGAGRAAVGAAGGAWAAWTAWVCVHPALGHDMVGYHLSEAVRWVQDGRPGAVVTVLEQLPVGDYPVTHEVLLEWGMAIGRSFAWVPLAVTAAPLLAAAAAWLGLRTLGVTRLVAGFGCLALVATPAVLASQRGGSAVDPAALAFLVAAAALALTARTRPAMLAPAVVAAGLAIGCKTTALPLAIAIVALGLVAARGHLRRLTGPLTAAFALVAVVGAFWYVRDLFTHGSPFWPFVSGPWGDARPRFVELNADPFIAHPRAAVDRLGQFYLRDFGGPLLLLAGALAAAAAARTRAVLAAAGATVVSVALWTIAPFTGVPALNATRLDEGAADATRFLLPGVACAVLAIALASRRPRLRLPAALLLATAAAIGLVQTFRLGFPVVPAVTTPLAGAVAGTAAALALARVRVRLPVSVAPALTAAVVVAAGGAGAIVAHGFVERHGSTGLPEAQVARWISGQPVWRAGGEPVASTQSLNAPLAGDRLRHRLLLVRPRRACARAAAERAWLVLDLAAQVAARAPGCGRPAYRDAVSAVYRPRGAAAGALTSPPRARRAPARRSPPSAASRAVRPAPGA
jgi:hypothetical protein